MSNQIFRSAINGFNRQDVTAYIEKAQHSFSERAQALESQIAELQKNGEQLSAELETLTQERDSLHTQLADMTGNRDRTAAELTAALEQKTELEQRLQISLAEQNSLNDSLVSMRSEVTAARNEKESVAQLELEARKRADAVLAEKNAQAEELLEQARAQAQALLTSANEQAENIITAAQERAEEIRAAMEAQVAQTEAEANKLISSVETITAHVAAELRKMDVAVTQLPISFNHLKDGLKDVFEQAADSSLTLK